MTTKSTYRFSLAYRACFNNKQNTIRMRSMPAYCTIGSGGRYRVISIAGIEDAVPYPRIYPFKLSEWTFPSYPVTPVEYGSTGTLVGISEVEWSRSDTLRSTRGSNFEGVVPPGTRWVFTRFTAKHSEVLARDCCIANHSG
jgi:hypothetical protein